MKINSYCVGEIACGHAPSRRRINAFEKNGGKTKAGHEGKLAESALTLAAIFPCAFIVILCGCSTVSVTTDYDHSASFANYHTYAVEPPANVPALSPSADSALRRALQENLAAKGIREVGAGDKPDLAVVPHARLEQRYTVEQYSHWGYGVGGWPYGAGYYGMWAGAPYTYSTIDSYTEGTLLLDFVDTSTKKLVFRGVGKATVGSPNSNAEKIKEAVTKIVAELPAAAASSPSAGGQQPNPPSK